MSISIVENRDCLEAMKEFPDKFFDLAIVDPPYGISIHKMSYCTSGAIMVGGAKRRDYSHTTDWDSSIPNEAYFEELFRVSKAQIVWGGTTLQNTYHLPNHLFVGTKEPQKNIQTILQIVKWLGVAKILVLQEFLDFYIAECFSKI